MFIDRDDGGKIIGRYVAQQRDGQEAIADESPELLLADSKRDKAMAIGAALSSALGAGVVWNGAAYPLDAFSQQCITPWGALAMGAVLNVPGMSWPANFTWLAADNTRQPFATAADFLAFAQAAAATVTTLMQTAHALKVSTTAAQTVDALAALDPASIKAL
jgi:hypothetical protein